MGHVLSRFGARALDALAVLACFGVVSCSALLDAAEEQCKTDGDCSARGFANATCVAGICTAADGGSDGKPWSCVGNVSWPTKDANVPASATVRVIRLLGQEPFPGLTVKICPPFDLSCANPMSEVVSGADGLLTLPVYKGFDGHFFAPAPSSFPEMAPMLVYLFPPPAGVEANPRDANLNLASVAEMTSIAQLGGVEVKPGLGHIFFTVYDCNMARAQGVSAKTDVVDTTTKVIYISDSGVPSDVLTETETRGEGAIINVPPGFVTVSAVSSEAGKFYQQTVAVQADHITGVPVVPSP
jgi:hypothetical protein